MLKVIKSCIHIPVFVMIRPRGGDFCYNQQELEVMKEDLLALKTAGADGFVFGILTEAGEVDTLSCQNLLEKAHPRPSTFHRAIDMTVNIFESLTKVVNLGFKRVLSSGGCNTALEGSHILHRMVQQTVGTGTLIVPGGGIRADNLEEILLTSKSTEFHGSARKVVQSTMKFRKSDVFMGSQPNIEFIKKVTSPEDVKLMVEIFNCLLNNEK